MEINTSLIPKGYPNPKTAILDKMGDPKVNYLCEGIGHPAVLLHGLAASLHDWDSLLPDMVKAGYETCAIDLLGHGDSYKPKRLDDYSISNVYAQIAKLINNLFSSKPIFLIGHSLGGYLALYHALKNPHQVRGIVLINPYFSMGQMSFFLRKIFQHPLLDTTLIRMTPYWLFRILIDLTSFQWGFKPQQHHNLSEEIRIQTALDYKRADPGIFNIPRTMIELKEQLSSLKIPILIIWGENDRTLNPQSFSELVKILPNAMAFPLSMCGHVPHQCDSLIFNKLVLDFLENID